MAMSNLCRTDNITNVRSMLQCEYFEEKDMVASRNYIHTARRSLALH